MTQDTSELRRFYSRSLQKLSSRKALYPLYILIFLNIGLLFILYKLLAYWR